MKIKWIGQSGYILSDEKIVIYIDPYLSDSVEKAAGRKRLVPPPVLPEELSGNAYICTHNHIDHLDPDTISVMNKDNIKFYAPSDCRKILSELGAENFLEFNCGDIISIGDFAIEAVYAKHTVPAIGLIVTYDGERLYFTGDTLYDERLFQNECDILFICINGKLGNMNAEEAAEITNRINPGLGIPNHYGMFESNTENPEKYIEKIDSGFVMELGAEYELSDFKKRYNR